MTCEWMRQRRSTFTDGLTKGPLLSRFCEHQGNTRLHFSICAQMKHDRCDTICSDSGRILFLICTDKKKDNTRIQGSQARVQQPRVLKPSQRCREKPKTVTKKLSTSLARGLNQQHTKKAHLRSNSDVLNTQLKEKNAKLINVLMFPTRITKMWRCFVNQAASSQKC